MADLMARARDLVSDFYTWSPEPLAKRIAALASEYAEERAADVRREVPTQEMLLAGARAIGATMGQENHIERARACWDAMQKARSLAPSSTKR